MLTEAQKDGLQEIMHIAFRRAAASLSELVENRVDLDAPEIYVFTLEELESFITSNLENKLVIVTQEFWGDIIKGVAFIALDVQSAIILSGLLDESRVNLPRFDDSDKEVILEVGNILINACVGTISNIMEASVFFSVPTIRIEEGRLILKNTISRFNNLTHAIVLITRFTIKSTSVTGCLGMILGTSSIESLMSTIERIYKEA